MPHDTASTHGRPTATSLRRLVVLVAGGAFAILAVTVGLASSRWIGTTFPGFFVLVNRVVPSIAVPNLRGFDPSPLFQHQVLAVDGQPVSSAAQVYALVADREPGTPVRYRLRAPDGRVREATVPLRVFTVADWLLLFGMYFVTGVSFAGTALFVFFLTPGNPAGGGLLAAGLTVGVFVVSAVDLYGPHHFTRLHVASECLGGAALLHLALVFPTVRVRRSRRLVLALLYAPFALLAVAYEILLYDPSAYTRLHLLAVKTHAVALLAALAGIVVDWVATRSPLVRRRIGVIALGTSIAFGIPLILMAGSALFGGQLPINAAAFTASLFPLSLGYAISANDLFEIDAVLRRGATYAVVVTTMALVFFAALLGLEWLLPTMVASPVLAALDLVLLLVVAPLHARAQRTVDRIFFRSGYDPEDVLARLTRELVSAHTVAEVRERTLTRLRQALHPEHVELSPRDALDVPREILARLDREQPVARYEWDESTEVEALAMWARLRADVLIPVLQEGRATIVLVMGPRGSGRPYGRVDVTFLQRVANQVAMALINAGAFGQLEALNATLEVQVQERTAALAAANGDLGRSLEELRGAYAQLERSQASLVRADRLATLGRLTAGLAHEVNTPLAAVMNALCVLEDLASEYSTSIDDDAVLPADHHEIASEMLTLVRQTAGYAEKAAAFIAKVKMHGREHPAAAAQVFRVSAVVDETRALLAHRLRAVGCTLEWGEATPPAEITGDPARLGQVIVNLVNNAVDAYEDHGRRGAVRVEAVRDPGGVRVRVVDAAGGMPAEVAARAFEELFTTKEPGRGTGLGLWIARNLIEETFHGTLTLETRDGEGTCFTIALPDRVGDPARESDGDTAAASGDPAARAVA